MTILIRFLTILISVISLLLLICLFRSLVYFQTPKDVELCTDSKSHTAINGSEQLFKRFTDSLKFKTITKAERDYDTKELLRFHEFLEKSFPIIHSSPFVKKQILHKYSLLYTVKGSNDSLRPYMLCAHMDVVPVETEKWTVDPFAGHIKDGYIYGRGAIDMKHVLMALMESLEYLLTNGFKPKRTFYLAFGHDEEGSGLDGAAFIAKVMKYKTRMSQLEYILDEGTMILDDTIKVVDSPVAIISVTEKGSVSLKLEAKETTGHSSLPMTETSIVRLAKALSKLNSKTFPSFIDSGVTKDFLESIAAYAYYPYKILLSNIWLFKSLLSYFLSQNIVSNSYIRTTTAVTVINGGVKPNVLPSNAYAIINQRIHSSQSVTEVIDYVKKVINDDSIGVSIHEAAFEPHPVSPYNEDIFGYQIIKRSIREVFPNTIVVPGILIASTDTKWYLDLTPNIYRFSPLVLQMKDIQTIHGHNERISMKKYVKMVNYYHHLMLNSDNEFIKSIKPAKEEL